MRWRISPCNKGIQEMFRFRFASLNMTEKAILKRTLSIRRVFCLYCCSYFVPLREEQVYGKHYQKDKNVLSGFGWSIGGIGVSFREMGISGKDIIIHAGKLERVKIWGNKPFPPLLRVFLVSGFFVAGVSLYIVMFPLGFPACFSCWRRMRGRIISTCPYFPYTLLIHLRESSAIQ